jgi:hypothetical protein
MKCLGEGGKFAPQIINMEDSATRVIQRTSSNKYYDISTRFLLISEYVIETAAEILLRILQRKFQSLGLFVAVKSFTP